MHASYYHFKLGHLLDDKKWISRGNLKKGLFFDFSVTTQIWSLKTCNKDMLKIVTAQQLQNNLEKTDPSEIERYRDNLQYKTTADCT